MSFPLIGNGKIRLSVENALKEHRLPHAILIDGDIGTGRHTLAQFLSFSALCSGDNIPCGECNNCKLANNKNHPDIGFITPEEGKKSIAVAQIRELKNKAYIKPHTADGRVFIIDFADTMNEQSQNALLKVLEEPPKGCYFILIAESKTSLLDTIISRCVILSLNPPTLDEGIDYIASATDFADTEIKTALEECQNNVGKALKFLSGAGDTKTALAAKEFFEYIIRGDQWNALCVLTPFEKTRVEADRLFKDLKYLIATEIKKNPASVRAGTFLRFYNLLSELEESLVTNINLSLLFADLTARAKEIIG